jgi:hypothetical protein
VGEFRIVRIYKITLEKVMNEGEGRRTLEVLYKGPTANFASEGLDASQSIHIKLPINIILSKLVNFLAFSFLKFPKPPKAA